MLYFIRSRLPLRIIFTWLAIVVFIYMFVIVRPRYVSLNGNELVHVPIVKSGSKVIDAVVFISMGSMAKDPLVDYAIASLRNAGKWKGDIYVLTDKESCFTKAIGEYNIKIVAVPEKKSVMDIKALKPRLLEMVPPHIDSILYLDVDIVITRGLDYFLNMIGRDLAVDNNSTSVVSHSKISSSFDYAAFGDARGHYVGFCAGCEKWHTGVMILRRGQGTRCLKAWEEIIQSGRYRTDQQALDRAEQKGSCPQAYMLPPQYLLFAKDYIASLLTTGHTFVHVTSAGRMSTQDGFYRMFAVPRIRQSLRDAVDPAILDTPKEC